MKGPKTSEAPNSVNRVAKCSTEELGQIFLKLKYLPFILSVSSKVLTLFPLGLLFSDLHLDFKKKFEKSKQGIN